MSGALGQKHPPILSKRAAAARLQFTRRQTDKAIDHGDLIVVKLGDGQRDQYITLASVEDLMLRMRECRVTGGGLSIVNTLLFQQAVGRRQRAANGTC